MEGAKAILCAVVILAAQLPHVLPSPITAPAFLWSSHGSSPNEVKEVVDYRTILPKDLVKSVVAEGGWSNLVCSAENNQNMDIALVFVGSKMQSSDISKTKHVDPALLELLKISFTSSNHSMAFPYVAPSDEMGTLENSLVSGFIDSCGQGFGAKNIAYLDSCSVDHEDIKKLQGMHSVMDFVRSRLEARESRQSRQTDMIVFCSPDAEESDNAVSEGEALTDLVKFLEQTGAKYSVLYVSDPYRSLHYSHLPLSRFLAESSSNASDNSTHCDGVCQIKSTLLEGIFVAIVLLIILISGLCCMMGIDTPTRFETPQES